jgi:2'-5' RNA ligase
MKRRSKLEPRRTYSYEQLGRAGFYFVDTGRVRLYVPNPNWSVVSNNHEMYYVNEDREDVYSVVERIDPRKMKRQAAYTDHPWSLEAFRGLHPTKLLKEEGRVVGDARTPYIKKSVGIQLLESGYRIVKYRVFVTDDARFGQAVYDYFADTLEEAREVRDQWYDEIMAAEGGLIPFSEAIEKEAADHKHSYSCVMGPMPDDISKVIYDWGVKHIPDDELYTDPEDPTFGRQPLDDIHCTVKFGFTANDSKEIEEVLQEFGPTSLKLGDVSIFDREENNYDVVKLDVEDCDGLREINKALSKLPNEDKFPKYTPHVTIAYVKKGMGKKYVGESLPLPDKPIELRQVEFCNQEEEKKMIPLPGLKKEAAQQLLREDFPAIGRALTLEQYKLDRSTGVFVLMYEVVEWNTHRPPGRSWGSMSRVNMQQGSEAWIPNLRDAKRLFNERAAIFRDVRPFEEAVELASEPLGPVEGSRILKGQAVTSSTTTMHFPMYHDLELGLIPDDDVFEQQLFEDTSPGKRKVTASNAEARQGASQ